MFIQAILLYRAIVVISLRRMNGLYFKAIVLACSGLYVVIYYVTKLWVLFKRIDINIVMPKQIFQPSN